MLKNLSNELHLVDEWTELFLGAFVNRGLGGLPPAAFCHGNGGRQTGSISWVCEGLKAAHPDDSTIADRFRAEQKASADAATTPGTQIDLSKPPSAGSSILDSIKVDPTRYDDAGENLINENYPDLCRRGNYALLADRPAEAKDYFERAYAVVPKKWLTESVENIARSIRAMHRSVGPANAWIISLKAAPAVPVPTQSKSSTSALDASPP